MVKKKIKKHLINNHSNLIQIISLQYKFKSLETNLKITRNHIHKNCPHFKLQYFGIAIKEIMKKAYFKHLFNSKIRRKKNNKGNNN